MSSGPRNILHHRFAPSDEELISVFLTKKIFDESYVHDRNNIQTVLDIYLYSPGRLIGDQQQSGKLEQKWYFFNKRNKNRVKRQVKEVETHITGVWHETGKKKRILVVTDNKEKEIGLKKTFDYYEGKNVTEGKQTGYVMEEFEADEKFLMEAAAKKGKGTSFRNSFQSSTSAINHENKGNIISSKSPAIIKAKEEPSIWVVSRIFLRSPSSAKAEKAAAPAATPQGKRQKAGPTLK